MPSVRSILHSLATVVAWTQAAEWDPVGLQVGDPSADVERVGVCHDVTAAVLDAAQQAEVDLLVAYHPVLFDASRRFVAGSGPSGLAFRAARSGIAIATVHTAFDVAAGGTADAMADAIGLADPTGFGPAWGRDGAKIVTFAPPDAIDRVAAAMTAAGAGSIGAYSGCSFRSEGIGAFVAGPTASPTAGRPGEASRVSEVRLEMVADAASVDRVVAALVVAHPYEEPAYDVYERRGEAGFVGRIGSWRGSLDQLEARVSGALGGIVRSSGDRGHPIETVAVVPGSGASLVSAAASSGADALVTGDVKHHDVRAAVAAGLAVVDPGHARTERPGVERLYAAVAAGWDDTVDLTGVDADPWNG